MPYDSTLGKGGRVPCSCWQRERGRGERELEPSRQRQPGSPVPSRSGRKAAIRENIRYYTKFSRIVCGLTLSLR